MKKLVIITLALVMALSSVVCGASLYKRYRKLVKREKIGTIKEYWTEDLTADILERRGDDIIVEKIIGTCLNSNGDGEIINTDSPCNYISYRGVKGVKTGDVVLTICIYNPGNNALDDIVNRFDYIIDGK